MSCCPPVNTDPRRFNAYKKPTPSRSEPLSHAEYLRRKAANNNLPLSKPQALVQNGSGPYVTTDWKISKPYTSYPSGPSGLYYALPAFNPSGLVQLDNNTFAYDSPTGRYVASASSSTTNYPAWHAFTRSAAPSGGTFSSGGAWFSATPSYDATGTYTGSTSVTVSPVGSVAGEYISIACPSYFILKAYSVVSSNKTGVSNTSTPMVSWTLAGSNDGTTYVTLDVQEAQSLNPNRSTTYSLQYNHLNYSKYILIIQSIGAGTATQGANLVDVQLYSETDPLDPGISCCANQALPAVPAVHPGGHALEAGLLTDSKGAAAGRGTISHFDTVNTTAWSTTLRRKGIAIQTDTGFEAPAGGRRDIRDTTLVGTEIAPGKTGFHSVGDKGL